MTLVRFIFVAWCLLLTTLILGGQPWSVFCLIPLIAHALTDLRAKSLVILVPSLGWLVLYRVTGNRELFFPYSMYLSTYVALLLCNRTFWLGSLGGSLAVSTFLTLRYLQEAPLRVLAVECGVAVMILAFTLIVYALSPRTISSRAVIAAGASLLAYGCLAI